MPYHVIDYATSRTHGEYATLDEARAAVRYDRIQAYTIWFFTTAGDGVEVETCDPKEVR